jgi:hypothetical protein
MTRHSHRPILFALAVSCASALGVGDLQAQDTLGRTTLAMGDRVRVSTTRSPTPFEGILTARSDGWLTVEAADGSELQTPVADIEIAERHSRQHNFWKYFGRTELAGTIGLSVLAGLTWQPCSSWLCIGPQNRAEAFLFGALGGAVLSLPVAVVVGALVKEDQWTAVRPSGPAGSLAERMTVDVRPTGSGVSLAASIALGGGS